jgi:hypothetical protein
MMARYASDEYALGISDRSGVAYRMKDMRKEWTGMLVGSDEWESKQPQLDTPKFIADPQALRNARPDRTEPAVTVLLPFNSFISGTVGSSVVKVLEPGHNRATGDTVRFRDVEGFGRDAAGSGGFTSGAIEDGDGYSVTKIDSDLYSFDVSDSSSSEVSGASEKGGGGEASAGPVTVSA